MRPIVLFSNGTRGDIQPALALALGLQRAGHTVRMVAPPAFRGFIEAYGVPYVAVDGNPSDLLGKGNQSTLTFDGSPTQNLRGLLAFWNDAKPVYAQMLAGAWQASQDARAIIINLPTIWMMPIAEALGVPCIGAFIQPLPPTHDYPTSIFPSAYSLGRGYNWLSYYLAGMALWLPWRGVINRWRTEQLGLRKMPLTGPAPRPFGKFDLLLHAFSEAIVPRAKEWAANVVTTGWFHLPTQPYSSSPALAEFIANGKPPFYIGFGSPGLRNPQQAMEMVLQAVKITNIRAIIAPPQGFTPPAHSTDVFFINESVPHEWLFPQMAGAVHHGGSGTTASVLRAGVPAVVIPKSVDQFFWGGRVFALDAGAEPIPQEGLTVERFMQGLKKIQQPSVIKAAQKLGETLRAEDGVRRAVREVEALLGRTRFG